MSAVFTMEDVKTPALTLTVVIIVNVKVDTV